MGIAEGAAGGREQPGFADALESLLEEMRPTFEKWGIVVDPKRPLATVSEERFRKVAKGYGVRKAEDLANRVLINGKKPKVPTVRGWIRQPGRMNTAKAAAVINGLGYARSVISSRDIRRAAGLERSRPGRPKKADEVERRPYLYRFDPVAARAATWQLLIPEGSRAGFSMGSAKADAERAAVWALMTFLKPEAIERLYQTAMDAALNERNSELAEYKDYSSQQNSPLIDDFFYPRKLLKSMEPDGQLSPVESLEAYREVTSKLTDLVGVVGLKTGSDAAFALFMGR